MAVPDSVPLMTEPAVKRADVPAAKMDATKTPAGVAAAKTDAVVKKTSIRNLLILFLLFLVIVSDFFANHVISKFGQKTMRGRAPSSWGVVLQGLFLVIGYAVLSHLDEQQIL